MFHGLAMHAWQRCSPYFEPGVLGTSGGAVKGGGGDGWLAAGDAGGGYKPGGGG